MSDRWWEYFESNLSGKHWLAGAVSQFQFMQPLYGLIQKYVPHGGKILDIGCGLGFNDIYLSSIGYQVKGIDNDQRIVESAQRNAGFLQTETNFKLGDAFDLSNEEKDYDLVYSLGVLEHFDREVTVELLRRQMACAKYVMIEIPSSYTRYSTGITDERIYSISELRKIVKEAGLVVETSFGFGDLMVTKWQRLIKRVVPYVIYRLLQNMGFCFCLVVIGKNPDCSSSS